MPKVQYTEYNQEDKPMSQRVRMLTQAGIMCEDDDGTSEFELFEVEELRDLDEVEEEQREAKKTKFFQFFTEDDRPFESNFPDELTKIMLMSDIERKKCMTPNFKRRTCKNSVGTVSDRRKETQELLRKNSAHPTTSPKIKSTRLQRPQRSTKVNREVGIENI
jgi:hypothetical protein